MVLPPTPLGRAPVAGPGRLVKGVGLPYDTFQRGFTKETGGPVEPPLGRLSVRGVALFAAARRAGSLS